MVKEESHKEKVRMILPRIGMREVKGKEGRKEYRTIEIYYGHKLISKYIYMIIS
ncbi:MAG: hypothetical protein WBQ25_04215 [Nitrososphaeraceae archaeon]